MGLQSASDGEGQAGQGVYAQLFESSPTPTAVFDLEGGCLTANRAFRRLGLDEAAQAGAGVRFTALFADPDSGQRLLEDLRAGEAWGPRPVALRGSNGEAAAWRASARLFNGVEGPRFEFSLEDGARGLLQALPAGAFRVDPGGKVVDHNAALNDLLHLEPDAAYGEPYGRFFQRIVLRAAEPEATALALQRAAESVEEHPAVEVPLAGKGEGALEVRLFPLRAAEGEAGGWGGLVQDVTEARRRSAWRLELLSMLAHDLRTPLASLKGHASALLANYRRWGDEMVLEFLEAMNRSTDDLVREVERSLALTRVEAGQLGLRPEAASPARLVQRALERASAALAGLQVQVDTPEDLPDVRVDPGRVEEVLLNLLDNAARYSPAGEPVLIRARVEGAMMRFSVLDAGPGVPDESVNSIFEKYARADAASAGAGLGLFICRRIAEAHGGQIWVESPAPETGRGAAFRFTLPVMPAAPVRRAGVRRVEAGAAPAPGGRVLVVEDNPDMQSLVHAILLEQGFEVELAPDGPTALDIVQTASPDLVLLDLALPRMDGLAVCRSLRRWSNVPILVITSRSSPIDLVAALDAGADDYLVKPFQTSELLARARALLRRADSRGAPEDDQRLRADGLLIDFAARQVWARGERASLTPTEFDLLALLARNRGQVLTHRQLINHVWEPREGSRHRLFVHISRLRKKLEDDPENPRFIVTRWGVGYSFMPR